MVQINVVRLNVIQLNVVQLVDVVQLNVVADYFFSAGGGCWQNILCGLHTSISYQENVLFFKRKKMLVLSPSCAFYTMIFAVAVNNKLRREGGNSTKVYVSLFSTPDRKGLLFLPDFYWKKEQKTIFNSSCPPNF